MIIIAKGSYEIVVTKRSHILANIFPSIFVDELDNECLIYTKIEF